MKKSRDVLLFLKIGRWYLAQYPHIFQHSVRILNLKIKFFLEFYFKTHKIIKNSKNNFFGKWMLKSKYKIKYEKTHFILRTKFLKDIDWSFLMLDVNHSIFFRFRWVRDFTRFDAPIFMRTISKKNVIQLYSKMYYTILKLPDFFGVLVDRAIWTELSWTESVQNRLLCPSGFVAIQIINLFNQTNIFNLNYNLKKYLYFYEFGLLSTRLHSMKQSLLQEYSSHSCCG